MLKSLANASHWLLAYVSVCLLYPKKQADICLNFATRTAHKKFSAQQKFDIFVFCILKQEKSMHAALRRAHCMQQWSWMTVRAYLCAFCCKQFLLLLLLLLPPFQFDALKGQLLYVILCWLNDELFKTRWQTRVHTLYSFVAPVGYVAIRWT